MRKFSLGFAALAIVAVTASVALADDMMSSKGNTFPFNPMSQSGQKGTVTVMSVAPSACQKTTPSATACTKVVIALTGEPEGAVQPAHIHKGDCAHPGAVIIPLTDVVGGASVTLVPKPISDVLITGDSVNTHKSASQLNIYMACADFKMAH
ncbi:MAG: hypothetical protein JO347_12360 [Candidatus Eremiobacteraeota bacterium]|nr:hypothetical protein [Candidatus Eremiobacteraeota bacterium]